MYITLENLFKKNDKEISENIWNKKPCEINFDIQNIVLIGDNKFQRVELSIKDLYNLISNKIDKDLLKLGYYKSHKIIF